MPHIPNKLIETNRRDNSKHASFMLIVERNFIWIDDNYYYYNSYDFPM